MSLYTEIQLLERDKIIQSQKKFWDFLDINIVNKLIHLFDNNSKNSNEKITKYIENERIIQGLDNSGVNIESYVYNYNKSDSSLSVIIKKNDIDFLHITIHLSVKSINPKHQGLIHMFKDIYKVLHKKPKNKLYVLINVKIPHDKPHSLEFSIADGYSTNINIANIYDSEIQKEMNVIIIVLNRLFDENNKEFYIGNKNILVPIHNITNVVLNNINSHISHVIRKNKGSRMYAKLNNTPFNIKTITPVKRTIRRKHNGQITRKRHRKY